MKIVRRFHEAVNRGEFDNAVQLMDPGVETYPGVAVVDVSQRYKGREEMREFFETISEGFQVVVELEEMIEAPGNRVVAVERWKPRGRQGMELDFDVTDVYAFRDGLIVRVDGYLDKAEALEAAGISE
jgi:ketosteroid isomerase-like protein